MRQPVPVLVKLCLIGVLLTATAWAQAGSDYTIDTINGIRRVGDGGVASSADLQFPSDVAVDGAGNLYIADRENNRIRRVDASGIITTIAGTGEAGFSGDGGLAVAADLGYPYEVAVDGAGNVYLISETDDHRIRRVDPSGIITTIAGIGEAGFSGDGGRGGSAQLDRPRGVAADKAGNLYIADTGNNRIRRVDPSGIITTIAGTGEAGFSGDGGPATEAMLKWPPGVAVDDAGNLYIADTGNNRIRRVDASGTISTVAELSYSVANLAVDRAGNLYFSTWPHLVRRVDPSGTIVTVAGTRFFHTWRGGFSGDGGPAVAAELHYPLGLAVDSVGNLYIADSDNFRIRRVDPLGIITTIAGRGDLGFSWDGGLAQLNHPHDVAVGAAGNVYIADRGNNCIRRMDFSRIITTIAGACSSGGGYWGDNGPAVAARLSLPSAVAVNGPGTLYIADTENQRIRRVDASGKITTVAGSGEYGYSGDNGPATQAQLKRPEGVAMDSAGNLYIADRENNRIRRVDASGIITTVAGAGEPGFKGDGGPATEAQLDNPTDVASDSAGNLYVADRGNSRIRRVDPSGKITTIAGTGVRRYSGDGGLAAAAGLSDPIGVAVDGLGNLYIASWNRIRRVDPSGTITTIAGIGERGYSGDGGPAVLAQLYDPRDVAVDGAGNIYIADSGNNRIRLLTLSLPPITLRAPTGLTAMAVSSSRVKLAWQDNSDNESGFRVQRRVDGSSDWVGIGTTAANATTFLDEGLEPLTAYHYRVQGFNITGVSAFSNETAARTLEALPPTLTGFTPTRGPVGAGAECVNKFETAEFPKLSYFLCLCRRIDPHLVRRSGDLPGSLDETLRVLLVSAIQSLLTSLENRAGLTVMDHRRREPAQARMVVEVVVPIEKVPAEGLGVLDGTESFGEVGAVLQGFELGFRERVVVGHLRPGVGLGHTQVRQQQCHRLRLHRRAAVSVENQLTAIDPLPVTAFTNQLFSQSRRFAIGHHPPHHLAAEDVEDHVEGEGGPLPGPLQPGDIPGPDLVGACC